MRYRVDVSGWRRVQTTVEVEAEHDFGARLAGSRMAQEMPPFVWEVVEDGEVRSVEVDHVEHIEEGN